jgi:hypothetical protein
MDRGGFGVLGRQWRVLAWLAAFAAAAVGLFTAYLLQSRTQAVNADGGSNALQAWDMLHGNLLLRGWTVSDVSFYTTELPQYMLVEVVRGLGSDVVHVSAAMTYTLLVLLAAAVAKGRATGLEAVTRALLAAGIMLAPQLGLASYTLLLSPDHVGTGVPLLLTWLIIDRGGHGQDWRRYLVPVTACVLLAWTAVGDPLAEVIGAVPLAAVCGVRAYHGLVQRREPLRERMYELSLLVAAALSVPAASAATKLIANHGGWTASAVRTNFATAPMIASNSSVTFRGLLELFGADFSGLTPGRAVVFAVVHLIGVALVAWAFWLAVRRFFAGELLVQVLTLAIVVNLAAYMFGVQVQDLKSTREIAAVLPFGAVLAGRLLAGKLLAYRPRPVTATAVLAGFAGYAAMLGFNAAQPGVPADNADLTTWLAQHNLSYGLAGYWQANSVTLHSGNRIQVRAIVVNGTTLMTEAYWEAKKQWYEPASNYANFLVTANSPGESDPALAWRLTAMAGKPAHVYQYGRYTIYVWDKNLLLSLGVG